MNLASGAFLSHQTNRLPGLWASEQLVDLKDGSTQENTADCLAATISLVLLMRGKKEFEFNCVAEYFFFCVCLLLATKTVVASVLSNELTLIFETRSVCVCVCGRVCMCGDYQPPKGVYVCACCLHPSTRYLDIAWPASSSDHPALSCQSL